MRPLRIAVVGAGHLGRIHTRLLKPLAGVELGVDSGAGVVGDGDRKPSQVVGEAEQEARGAGRAVVVDGHEPAGGIVRVREAAERIGLGHDIADAIEQVSTEEARAMALRLAREEGLFAGTSTGGNVIAALRLAERLGPGATIVTVMCDTGIMYLRSFGG